MQQNSSERAPAPLPEDSSPMQTPCYNTAQILPYTIHDPLQLESAYRNNCEQEEWTQSPSSSSPNRQSQHDLYTFCSSHEPTDTDPDFVQTLWCEVLCNKDAHNCPNNPLSISIMASSAAEQYDPQGFSSTAFPEVLERYQVTIESDVVVPSNPVVSPFWLKICGAARLASTEVIPELASCEVWNDIDEGAKEGGKGKEKATAKTETETELKDLVARFKTLLADRDSTLTDRQLFVLEILRSYPLPGVRVFNDPKILEATTEPYHLIPSRESSVSSLSTQPNARKLTTESSTSSIAMQSTARKSAKPKPSTTRSTTVSHRSALQNTARPAKIDPTVPRKLNLPKDNMDHAYWLEASEFQPLDPAWIARRTFVSGGTNQKTSPYLSFAFENSECRCFTQKRLLAKHKIAVYGSTALYNRYLLYAKVLEISRNGRSSNTRVERSLCNLHFGLVVVDDEATLYVFRCKEENSRETDQATGWQGCSMARVEHWILTNPDELADMLYHLRIVADWVKRVYTPALHDDLLICSTTPAAKQKASGQQSIGLHG